MHDDKYDTPDLNGYQCGDLTANMTLADAKALPQNATITTPSIIEGYVSSSDETGNIYKTLYIQDDPQNPTHGFVVSLDAVSTYTKFPQGSKVYINLEGLAMGTYGGLTQLGYMSNGAFGRIPEGLVAKHITRSCSEKVQIKPKVMTLADMPANNNLLGALIQIDNAEFHKRVLCATYAPDGVSVDRPLNDPTSSSTSNRVVRNSGYASFANQIMPSGNGKFVGIFSRFNNTYQMYINRVTDLEMNGPRLDGSTITCEFDPANSAPTTIAAVKAMHTSGGAYTQITNEAYIKGTVTANDETGNLFKYIYIEDATGGIKVNINKQDLFEDSRFVVGKELIIRLKDLYIGKKDGEFQLGVPFQGQVGQIAQDDVYKYFYDSNKPVGIAVPTEKTIDQLTSDDIGRLIRIKDLQFIDADLNKPYAGSSATNRTLTDCSGNEITLRTSNFASFAGTEVDGGKGDVTAILSYYGPNNQYQLWIRNLHDADLDNPRCDGSVPSVAIFNETFSGTLANWTAVSVSGAQVWNIQNFGNPRPCVVMNGYQGGNNINEDWLISAPISLNGYSQATVSFDSDGRYQGDPLMVYATDNFTGDPATTTWTQLPAVLDSNLNAFNTWTNSGNLSLNSFLNKNVRIAFKYTSTAQSGTTWEIDNVRVKAH